MADSEQVARKIAARAKLLEVARGNPPKLLERGLVARGRFVLNVTGFCLVSLAWIDATSGNWLAIVGLALLVIGLQPGSSDSDARIDALLEYLDSKGVFEESKTVGNESRPT